MLNHICGLKVASSYCFQKKRESSLLYEWSLLSTRRGKKGLLARQIQLRTNQNHLMLVALQSDMFQSQPLCILGGIYVKMTRIFCYVFRSAPTHEMEF